MRFYFAIIILIVMSCNSDRNISVNKIDIKKFEYKKLINSNYYVINRFPQIEKSQFNDSIKKVLNEYFENVNELYLIKDSLSFKFIGIEKEIVGDFLILSNNDSIISFEFFVRKGGNIVSYKPVFLDIINGKLYDCEEVLKNISKNKLGNFVEVYANKTNYNINLDAYKDESKIKLSYAKKGNILYIYAGKEGEFGGKYKIEVPLNSVTLH